MRKLLSRGIVDLITLKGAFDVRQMFKNAEHAQKINNQLLMRILKTNRGCEYGKKYGFADIHSVEEFKQRVPIVRYDDIAEDVERIYNENAQNVLTSQKIVGFARSSGSIGKPKIIPRTAREITIYTRYTVSRFLYLARQYQKKNGKRISISARGICALCQHREKSPFGLNNTNVADIAAKRYYAVYPYILNLPLGRQFSTDEIDIKYANIRYALEDRDTLFMFSVFAKNIVENFEYMRDNWQMLLHDIETGTISETVSVKPEIRRALLSKCKPNPRRAAELRHIFEQGFDSTIARRIWPNLSVISAIGTSPVFEPFVRMLRPYIDDISIDYSIYGASEGLFAAAYAVNEIGQLMLPDSCYYEFVDADNDGNQPITKTLSMEELGVGKSYEIIITNQSGFYRYRIKDIITVLGFRGQCPIINFAYRRGQLLNINGEKTDIAQMSEAIKRLERDTGAEIPEWAVYINKGKLQYRYVICLETKDGRDMSGYSEQFQQHLRDVNTSYDYYERVKGLIEPPLLLNQSPGSHQAWRSYKIAGGASREQVKPVRIFDTEEKKKFFLERLIPSTCSMH